MTQLDSVMAKSSDCPSERVVADYAAGKLPEDDSKKFESHLANCHECAEAVEWVKFHFFSPRSESDSDSDVSEGQRPRIRMLGMDPVEIPEDPFDVDRLRPKTKNEVPIRKEERRYRRVGMATLAIAAFMVISLAVAWFFGVFGNSGLVPTSLPADAAVTLQN